MPRKIILVSNQNDKFEITEEGADLNVLVKSIVEEYDGDCEIPLINIDTACLVKIIEFSEYHAKIPMDNIEKPLKSPNLKNIISDWDLNFIDVEQELLYKLVLAANYIDNESLLDLCCAKIASTLKGKTSDEIRNVFGIENDFTQEEKERLAEENKILVAEGGN